MPTLNAARSALVLVDYQARLMPAIHEAPAVLRAAVLLADVARLAGVRVVGTEQNPDGLGPNVDEVRRRCDTTLAKMHFDACRDGLTGAVDAPEVVIAGCEAHVCLLQTALGLLDAGRRVWVVETACGSRRPADKAAAMARLRDAGATRVTPEMVLFEWAGTCEHPAFRPLLRRLKEEDAAQAPPSR